MTELTDLTKISFLLFVVVFALNLLPAFAPPTWTAMSFIGLTIPKIDFVLTALVAATAATCGRIVLAKLSRVLVRQKWLSEQTQQNVDAIRLGIEGRPVMTFGTVLGYSISPLPSNYLFIAYGLTSLPIMGRLDGEQIADAIDALAKRDTALAKRVIAADDQVDALQREIEEKAATTIARRQPMAVDLREILGALRISNDLERIGDLAENVAKWMMLVTEELRLNEVVLQLRHMVDVVRDQLARVLQGYERRDVAVALDVWRKDQEIDALNTGLFRELLTFMMEDPRKITFCIHMLFCAKNIERMGDHATNIAETVYYIVQGTQLKEERPKADVTSKEMLPQRL